MLTRKGRSRHLFVSLLGLTLVATACGGLGGSDGGGGSEDSTIRVAVPETIVSLDPQGAQSAERATQLVAQHLFDTLVVRSPNGKDFEPGLATAWSNPSPTTWVFELREGVEFHDGTEFTAQDVKASLERVVAEQGPFSSQWLTLESVEATAEHEVTITTSEPLGTMLGNLTLLFVAPAEQLNQEGFWSEPVGTGAFKFDTFVPDEIATLTANEDYWGDEPQLQRIEFVEMPEISSRMTALETGEIDATWSIPPDQLPQLEGNSDVVVESILSYSHYFVWFNSSSSPFEDQRVRRAMWHAVDVDSVVNDLFAESADVASAPIPEPVFGWSERPQYEYDPELARQLLAEAGYPDGLETSIQFQSGQGPNIRQLAQAFGSYWADIGVNVEIQEKEAAAWLEDLLALNWSMNIGTNNTLTGDADFTLGRLYVCEANRNGYCNEELDRVLLDARRSVDPTEREALYERAADIIWNEAVGIFPMDLRESFAWRSNVNGFEPVPSTLPRLHDVTVE